MSTKTEDKETNAALAARIDALSERLELLATATLPASGDAYKDAIRAEDDQASKFGNARERVKARKAALQSFRPELGASIAEEDAAENREYHELQERNKAAKERREREEIERERREIEHRKIHPIGIDANIARTLEGVLAEIAPAIGTNGVYMVTIARSWNAGGSRDYIGEQLQKLYNRPGANGEPEVVTLRELAWRAGKGGCRATVAKLASNADAVEAVKYQRPDLVKEIEAHADVPLLIVYIGGDGTAVVFEAHRGPGAEAAKVAMLERKLRRAERERAEEIRIASAFRVGGAA